MVRRRAQTPSLSPFPDLMAPQAAFPTYLQPGVDAATVARLDDVYIANLDMPDLVEKVSRPASRSDSIKVVIKDEVLFAFRVGEGPIFRAIAQLLMSRR